MADIREETLQFQRDALNDRLAQCTEAQQAFFHRIFAKFGGMPEDKDLVQAIDLCDRTIKKNLEGR